MTVTRDNQLDKEYARKQLFKARVARARAKTLDMTYTVLEKAQEAATPVKLDIFDYMYGTNLRAQYFAGKRTQKILAAKRSYGL